MPTYLEELTIRLAGGLGQLPESTRARHIDYLMSQQKADGGFGGREGGSDLYYTGFALRALAVLGELTGELSEHSAAYLKTRLTGQESIVDFLSLVYGAMLLDVSGGIARAEWSHGREPWLFQPQRERHPSGVADGES